MKRNENLYNTRSHAKGEGPSSKTEDLMSLHCLDEYFYYRKHNDSTESAAQDSLKMTWTCIGGVLNKTYIHNRLKL